MPFLLFVICLSLHLFQGSRSSETIPTRLRRRNRPSHANAPFERWSSVLATWTPAAVSADKVTFIASSLESGYACSVYVQTLENGVCFSAPTRNNFHGVHFEFSADVSIGQKIEHILSLDGQRVSGSSGGGRPIEFVPSSTSSNATRGNQGNRGICDAQNEREDNQDYAWRSFEDEL
ncbi:hypothetical protein B0H12DRAFT_1170526 [Mycena haematopus]|nr:hypothetical protein B0H12DRAFT_1170526 [Mycena haematopus]